MHPSRISVGRNGLRPYIEIEHPWGGTLRRHQTAFEVVDILLGVLSFFFAPPPLNLIAVVFSILTFVGIRQVAFATPGSGTVVATGASVEAEVTRFDEDKADTERER